MKLWLLKLVESESGSWDEAQAFVVRAETELTARQLASQYTLDTDHRTTNEDQLRWKDSAVVTCVELTTEGPEEVVIRDYNNG